jgi:hypothetical protein
MSGTVKYYSVVFLFFLYTLFAYYAVIDLSHEHWTFWGRLAVLVPFILIWTEVVVPCVLRVAAKRWL